MAAKKRILIVEDEGDLVQVLKQRLEFEGYDVVCALDGQEGLRIASEEGVDAIVLDIMLPVMDGFEFMKRLRGSCSSYPSIVVITAYGSKFSEEQWRVLEGCEILRKPFEPEDLLKSLKDKLS